MPFLEVAKGGYRECRQNVEELSETIKFIIFVLYVQFKYAPYHFAQILQASPASTSSCIPLLVNILDFFGISIAGPMQ
jgi:hypothetical protein